MRMKKVKKFMDSALNLTSIISIKFFLEKKLIGGGNKQVKYKRDYPEW